MPRLLSGRIDLAIVRPPEHSDKRLEFLFLFHETAVVAVPARHKLGARKRLSIEDLADQPLIVPKRRSRPHSHDVTVNLFAEAGLRPTIAQVAEEKQTIVNLVAADMGVAIVPRWTSRMAVSGVRYIPLKLTTAGPMNTLPLAAACVRGSRDPVRDEMLAMLREKVGGHRSRRGVDSWCGRRDSNPHGCEASGFQVVWPCNKIKANSDKLGSTPPCRRMRSATMVCSTRRVTIGAHTSPKSQPGSRPRT